MSSLNKRQQLLETRLIDALKGLFPDINTNIVKELQPFITWVEIEGGKPLFKQGDISDSICILLSGRLQAIDERNFESPVILGEIYRGQTVGEMGIFTGEARNASVYAVRGSVLVIISAENYLEIISKYPKVALNTGKLIIDRLKPGKQSKQKHAWTSNIAVLPIHKSFPTTHFVQQYVTELEHFGNVYVLNAESAKTLLGFDFGQTEKPGSYDLLEFQFKFDRLEEDYAFVVYLADYELSEWTKICLKQADEVYLVADSTVKEHDLSEVESQLVFSERSAASIRKHLVLLHPPQTKLPEGTRFFLNNRNLDLWHHIRMNKVSDFQRLARFTAGKAIGFALAGGGAKGFVHLGIFKAFREHNIPADMFAGTSAGALAVAILSQMLDDAEGYEYMKNLAKDSPTKGSNRSLIPIISLLKGKSLDNYLEKYFAHIFIEDLWIQSSIAATNLSNTSLLVFDRGPLNEAIRASISLPGIFPPAVYQQELYVDGATISNLPLFALKNRGLGYLGAIALHTPKKHIVKYNRIPEAPALLLDRLLRRKKYRVPTIISVIMNSIVLASHSQLNDIEQQADIFLCPDTSRINLMDWMKYDPAIEIGYNYALQHIDAVKEIIEQ
jgi:NTE family protein